MDIPGVDIPGPGDIIGGIGGFFGGLAADAGQAIVDYVHNRLSFGYGYARSARPAAQAHEERVGVCRDFAHLAITLCRCMNIPARYVNGYLGDIGVPQDPAPTTCVARPHGERDGATPMAKDRRRASRRARTWCNETKWGPRVRNSPPRRQHSRGRPTHRRRRQPQLMAPRPPRH